MFCDTLSSGIKQPVCTVGKCPIRDSLKFNVFCVPSEQNVFVLCFNRKLFDSYSAPRNGEGFLMRILAEGVPNDMLLEQDRASHYLHAAVRTVLPGSNDLTEMDWKSRLASTSWPPPSTDTTPVWFRLLWLHKGCCSTTAHYFSKLARRIQAAEPNISPVLLLNVWTQLEHRDCADVRTVSLLHASKLLSVGHKTLSNNVKHTFFHSIPLPFFEVYHFKIGGTR